jgi:hypothetical protein
MKMDFGLILRNIAFAHSIGAVVGASPLYWRSLEVWCPFEVETGQGSPSIFATSSGFTWVAWRSMFSRLMRSCADMP